MQNQETVTHKEILDRVVQLEGKVDSIATNTAGVVAAFEAAQGAFKVLDFVAKVAKPILVVAVFVGAMAAAIKGFGR